MTLDLFKGFLRGVLLIKLAQPTLPAGPALVPTMTTLARTTSSFDLEAPHIYFVRLILLWRVLLGLKNRLLRICSEKLVQIVQ
jgi:hypothetical protein